MEQVIPKKRSLYKYAVDTFVDLLNKVQSRVKSYRCNDLDIVCWNAFVKFYDDRDVCIGKDFIKSFIDYGIHSWFNSSTDDIHKYNVRFSWIFSKKSIERYRKFDDKTIAKITRKGLSNVVRKARNVQCNLIEVYTTVRISEENMKKQYHNTKKGLTWCVSNVSLYNHKSTYCASCLFKNDCKELLKVNFPKIYKARGYD
jgi:hypothetical protein